MTLQVAGVGVLCGVTGLRAPNCGGERVVIHDEGGRAASNAATVATLTETLSIVLASRFS